MHPDLVSIGPVILHTYGLLVAIGIIVASLYLTHLAPGLGKSRDEMLDLILATVASGFLVARIFYVLYQFNYYREHPLEVFAIWQGGIIFYGGLLGGVAGFFLWAKRSGWPVLKTLDGFVAATALAQAFGRIGCFLNGCCYGKPTMCPLGVTFPFSGIPLHPTQLYEAAFLFALFFFLAYFRSRYLEKAGATTLLYFTLQSVGRFAVEFFRDDMPRLWLGMTLGQWMSLGIFFLALGICAGAWWRNHGRRNH